VRAADQIRPAEPTDAAALLAIYTPVVRQTAISFELEPPTEAAFAARIERVTATDPWLVLERDGAVAGYAYATDFRGRAAYAATRETTVYVHPDHRRTGVARRLMVALLDEMARRGAHVAVAVIALPNPASVALHEALGFSYVGTVHEAGSKFGTWHDEGFWEQRLRAGTANRDPRGTDDTSTRAVDGATSAGKAAPPEHDAP
jgi:L-amino acid N-acyltransferase YncA